MRGRYAVTVTVDAFIYFVFLSNEASILPYYSYILINCYVLKRFYLLSVIKKSAYLLYLEAIFLVMNRARKKDIVRLMKKYVLKDIMQHITVAVGECIGS
jgi:hypothetical protein